MSNLAFKKFIITDDHSIVRDGLEIMLATKYSVENIHSVKNGSELLDALGKQDFDLVILDVQLPDITAFSLIPQIFEKKKHQKILMFSMYPEKTMTKVMLDLGAMGYLNKESPQEMILNAVETILGGNKYISPNMLHLFTNKFLNNQGSDNPVESLSGREMEVLMLLLQGNGVLEISNALDLKSSTVATYKGRIFEKMDVKNVIELYNKGMLLGLV